MSATLKRLAEVVAADEPLASCGVPSSVKAQFTAVDHSEPAREIDFIVEAIHEGYLLHYEAGRVLQPTDPDLALLAGDRLYALGLARLAELGDLDAVRRLADCISSAAQAQAEERIEDARRLWSSSVAPIS